jgi:GNAT superfamily N-acetyltransferase
MKEKLKLINIREIDPESLKTYSCSIEGRVQSFIRETALYSDLRHITRTQLLLDENENVIGYFTLFNTEVRILRNQKEKLNVGAIPYLLDFPAIRLHYLGISDRYKRQGYGSALMKEIFLTTLRIAEVSGLIFLVIESTLAAEDFYKNFGFIRLRKHDDDPSLIWMAITISDIKDILEVSSQT